MIPGDSGRGCDTWRLALSLWENLRGNVIAGSDSEKRAAELLASVIETVFPSSSVRKIAVDVLSWSLNEVSIDPEPEWTVVAPYVESFSVEAGLYIMEGNPLDHRAWKRVPEGSIVLTRFPDDPDDLKAVALHAHESGAIGLLVAGKVERRIVTTGVWGYPWFAGAPTPVPVIVVDEKWAVRRQQGEKVSLYVDARARESTSYILRLLDGGAGRTMVGAHYDKWMGGFQDNILGVAQAICTARILGERGLDYELVLFPAEESGAPGYAGWYWAWASRWYAWQYDVSNVDGVELYINFDMAGDEPLMVSGAPHYVKPTIEGLTSLNIRVEERRWECPECDSFSLAISGIPTLSFHTLWNERVRTIYHTPLDTPSRAIEHVAKAAVATAVMTATRGPSWSHAEATIIGCLRGGGLHGRLIAYELESLAKRHGWRTVFSWTNKWFLKPVHIGDYRLDGQADINAVYFPEVCLRDLEEAKVHAVWVPGEEKILYHPSKGIREQRFYNSQRLLERFRELASWTLNK